MPEVWRLADGGAEVSQDKLDRVALELISAAGDINVWLFFGEMGSGKTTLIKAVGTALAVTEGMSSPTFSLVNEYKAGDGRKIYHFDLYRLIDQKEVFDIGVEEYFDSNGLCLVEWPEKLGGLTPANSFKIRITPSGPLHRIIEYRRA